MLGEYSIVVYNVLNNFPNVQNTKEYLDFRQSFTKLSVPMGQYDVVVKQNH